MHERGFIPNNESEEQEPVTGKGDLSTVVCQIIC